MEKVIDANSIYCLQPKHELAKNIKKHINAINKLIATNGAIEIRCYNSKQFGYYSS